jgi:ketosteroid isomerase-like protein
MRLGSKFLAFILLSLAVLVPVSIGKARSENTAVSVVEEFTRDYNNKDTDKIVALYATDALMVSETGVAQGRDAIKARLSVGMQRGNTIDSLLPEKNESSGDLSFAEGMANVSSGGQHVQRHYLVIVKKVRSHNEIVVHYSLPNPETKP